jgi:hypothetical protein
MSSGTDCSQVRGLSRNCGVVADVVVLDVVVLDVVVLGRKLSNVDSMNNDRNFRFSILKLSFLCWSIFF